MRQSYANKKKILGEFGSFWTRYSRRCCRSLTWRKLSPLPARSGRKLTDHQLFKWPVRSWLRPACAANAIDRDKVDDKGAIGPPVARARQGRRTASRPLEPVEFFRVPTIEQSVTILRTVTATPNSKQLGEVSRQRIKLSCSSYVHTPPAEKPPIPWGKP